MSSAPQGAAGQSFSFARVLLLLILGVVLIGAVYVVKSRQWDEQAREKEPTLIAQMGFGPSTPMQLDPQYKDADGDLVADTPTDPAQQVKPDKLIFSFIG